MYVTISISRYEELIRKEVAYDIRKAELENGLYVTTVDKELYHIEEKKEADNE